MSKQKRVTRLVVFLTDKFILTNQCPCSIPASKHVAGYENCQNITRVSILCLDRGSVVKAGSLV